MRGQHGVRARGPTVWRPRRRPQTAPDRPAVQVQPAGDLRDRHPLAERQPANLLPLLLTDHRHLLGWGDLRSDRPGLALDLPRHFAPSSLRRDEHFSLPIAEHYWLPDDMREARPPGPERPSPGGDGPGV